MSDKKLKPSEKPHYVNNRQFSEAVMDYVKSVRKAQEEGKPNPIVTNYIASCFLKISEGLSYKSNFIRYTYREEMVMDAVENCLRAVINYNIEAATRTGKPNAFSYFTQIAYFAFLRRIEKEKKQQDIKLKYIEKSGVEDFLYLSEEDLQAVDGINTHFVDDIRGKFQQIEFKDKETEKIEKEIEKIEKPKEGLELFT